MLVLLPRCLVFERQKVEAPRSVTATSQTGTAALLPLAKVVTRHKAQLTFKGVGRIPRLMGESQGHTAEEQGQIALGEMAAVIFGEILPAAKGTRMCHLVSHNLGNNHNKDSTRKLREDPRDGVTGSLMG